MQYRALTEALKDLLNNLGSGLDNPVGKQSKSVDDKIYKTNSAQNSRYLEDLVIRIRKTLVLLLVSPIGKGG